MKEVKKTYLMVVIFVSGEVSRGILESIELIYFASVCLSRTCAEALPDRGDLG